MSTEDADILDVLVEQDYISAEDRDTARTEAQQSNVSVVDLLLQKELATRQIIGEAMAEHYGVKFAEFNAESLPTQYLSFVPHALAKRYRLFVVDKEDTHLTVATDRPERLDKITLGNIFRNYTTEIVYTLPEVVDAALQKSTEDIENRFHKIIEGGGDIAPNVIEELLQEALRQEASDIHIEPKEDEACIRFRIDGMLQEVTCIDTDTHEQIVRVVKLRADLDTDITAEPQDGTIRIDKNEKPVDLRISIVPLINGEKVVIRILSEYISGLSFAELGLSERDQSAIEKVAQNPFGMILTVGPTGSGKTTTLYSILRLKNTVSSNIMTIEDPVEYKIPGVNHMNVDPKRNVTFARGLRSIVRQDPDIMLVGEIRDEETAEIAANAALTGHLVLSSFHANDAATAFPRLIDMGIEPFLLSSTLEMVVGQRLVRRLCTTCRYSTTTTQADLRQDNPEAADYFPEGKFDLYQSKGCEECNHTGYRGRVAIFEIIYSTPEMQRLVLTNPTSAEVWELARSEGAHTLFEDGIEKVKVGITSLEEVMRVAMPPEYASVYGESS